MNSPVHFLAWFSLAFLPNIRAGLVLAGEDVFTPASAPLVRRLQDTDFLADQVYERHLERCADFEYEATYLQWLLPKKKVSRLIAPFW